MLWKWLTTKLVFEPTEESILQGMADLTNASVVRPRDPGSNLSIDKKYFLGSFVSHLNSNLLGVNSWTLAVNMHVYWTLILNPTMHIAKNPSPQYGDGPHKNVILNCIDSTHSD
jgi:hypothetical protein